MAKAENRTFVIFPLKGLDKNQLLFLLTWFLMDDPIPSNYSVAINYNNNNLHSILRRLICPLVIIKSSESPSPFHPSQVADYFWISTFLVSSGRIISTFVINLPEIAVNCGWLNKLQVGEAKAITLSQIRNIRVYQWLLLFPYLIP